MAAIGAAQLAQTLYRLGALAETDDVWAWEGELMVAMAEYCRTRHSFQDPDQAQSMRRSGWTSSHSSATESMKAAAKSSAAIQPYRLAM